MSVLLIGKGPEEASRVEELLRESDLPVQLRRTEGLEQGLRALRETAPDVLIVDLELYRGQWTDAVASCIDVAPEVPIVTLGDPADLEGVLSIKKAGVAEHLQKEDLTPSFLARALQWARDRERMQAKISQRDAWVRSIAENVSEGIFRAGPTGLIEYANDALAYLFGRTSGDEMRGVDFTTLYADSSQQGRMGAAEQGEPIELEFERPDGTTFTGLLSTEAARRSDGTVVHFDGVLTNITERKETERRLRMLSEALTQAKEAVLITEATPLDEPGPRIVCANEAFEEMTGYCEEEILGKTPRILQGPETERSVLDSLRAALTAEEEWEGETINYRKDGTPYRVQWTIAPVRGTEREIEYWVSVQRDVTEKRTHEEELRRQKRLLEQTQRLAGAWEMDLHSGTMSWSDEVYRIHEVEPETELSIDDGIEFYAPEARPKIREAVDRCVQEGEAYDLELPIVTAKGNRRWVRTVGAPSERKAGEVVKVAGAFQDITERRETEEELRHSREQLSMAVEGGNIGTWNWDLETDRVVFNRQWAEMLGYSRDELDFHFSVWEELVHPDDLPRAMKVLEAYLEGHSDTYNPEIRMRTKSGDWKWIQAIGKVLERDEEGTPTRAAGIHLDIDERKRAEQALKEREAQLRGLTNSIPGVVFQSYARPGPEYGFYHVSKHAEDILGIPRDPSDFFERCLSRVPEAERERLMDLIGNAVDAAEQLEFEAPFVKPSGETIWLLGAGAPEPREDEVVYNGVILDITERKEMQQEVRRTKEFYEQVFDQIPIDLAVFDQDGRFEYLNEKSVEDPKRQERIRGLTNEEYFRERGVDPELGRRRDAAIQQVLETGEPMEIEETLNTEEGPRHFVRVHGPVTDPDGRITHVVGYGVDITNRKKYEERLREAKEQAEEATRMKSVFLANMSHEIRTPLTSILGFAEAIGEEITGEYTDDVDPPILTQFAALIERSGRRLLETLDAVLELSKLEAGEMKLTLGPVDLAEEAVAIAEQFRAEAEETDVTLEVEAEGPVRARADEGGVHIAIRNLVSNAVKYTEPGGCVWVRAHEANGTAVIEVEDTGIGMDPDQVDDLFKAFKQESQGLGREYEGTGLGLTLTQRVMAEMGGTISVETEKGKGSRFALRFPKPTEGEG